MFLQVLAHLGCPGQGPESRKTVVVVIVKILINATLLSIDYKQQHKFSVSDF